MKTKSYIVTGILSILLVATSCEDLSFGNSFLQKPPSTDVTIDTIFAKGVVMDCYLMEWRPMAFGHRCV